MINNIKEKISTGKTGAISELLVCANLLEKGYEVFRSVSQDCSCDLLAMKDNKILKIEVKTVAINKNGSLNYGIAKKNINRFDILANVVDGIILYQEQSVVAYNLDNKKNGKKWKKYTGIDISSGSFITL
jgi:Holliday junction resolvase